MTDEKNPARPDVVEHASLAAALAVAQSEMDAVHKANTAKAGQYNYTYADLAAVIAACLPALNRNGIAVVQPTGWEGDTYYVETRLLHAASKDELSCRVPLIVGKRDMQGYGSAVTYARRYGLMAMVGIAPEDDDGKAASDDKPRCNSTNRRAPKNQDGPQSPPPPPPAANDGMLDGEQRLNAIAALRKAADGFRTLDALGAAWGSLTPAQRKDPEVQKAKADWKAEIERVAAKGDGLADTLDDNIPF